MAQVEIVLAGFLLIALFSSLVSRKARTPYTTLLVLIGLGLAVLPLSQVAGLTQYFSGLAGSGLFVGLILPPLLFESIMSVKVADFRAVYRSSLLLATFGILVSALVVGTVLWKVVGLTPLVSFLFAALISPTDVATVLEIFARVNVPSRLATLIEMESVFNDATGIALFSVVLTAASATALQPLQGLASFAKYLGGGVLVGLGVAWAARYIQRQVMDTVSQVVLTLAAVYGAYGLASYGLGPYGGFSGLIAVAVTGLFYGNSYVVQYKDKQVADATREFWRVLAFVANAVAFFYIGVSTNVFLLWDNLGGILVAFGVVVMARVTSVYPILGLTRVAGSSIPVSWMNTAALGGMRGALAIVLVADIPPDPAGTSEAVAALTFGVVFLSIMLQGPLFTRYTRRFFGRQETLPPSGTAAAPEGKGPPTQPETLSPDRQGTGGE